MGKQLSCYIIGDDKLIIQCGEILLARKHQILGIITSTFAVQSWADKHHITCFNSLVEFKNSSHSKSCDYLFSIINYQILPEWILALPKYFAINYHDSLLPQYAGVHATSWALLNGEKNHGITWHIMEKKIDAGDILKQAKIVIDKNETTLSLNLKCFQAAVETFSVLVDELVTRTYARKSQDLTQRTYYAFNQKPYGNGWINWNDAGENIERLYRVLKFGDYPNRFSVLKFIVQNKIYIVDELKLTKSKSKQFVGSIVKINHAELQVATQTHNVIITRLKTQSGHYCDIKTFNELHKLSIGDCLSSPTRKIQHKYQEISSEITNQEHFWVKQLLQINPATLPFLRSESIKKQHHVLFSEFKLSIKLQNDLKKIFLKQKNSLEKILCAALFVYLYRLNNNQEKLSIAVTDHLLMQNPSKLNSLVASSLPLTLQLNDKLNFENVLKMLEQEWGALNKHGTYLKDIYGRYPELGDVYQELPIGVILGELPLAEKKKLSCPIIFQINKSHIYLYAQKLILNQNFSYILKHLFDQLNALLKSIVSAPRKKISQFSLLLASKERKKILIDWNKTNSRYPKHKNIIQLFEEQAEKTPNKIAIIFGEQQLTYRQLDKKANELAHYLQKQGVKVGQFIPICVERSIDAIVGILGILKVGGIYVPVDPAYPEERFSYILQDIKSKIILTQTYVARKFDINLFEKKTVIYLDQVDYISQSDDINNQALANNYSKYVYVIYTSGSTGKPKGVLIEHSALINTLRAIYQELNFSAADVLLAIAPLTFDISCFDIFLPLITGAKIIFCDDSMRWEPDTIIQAMNKHHVTIMQATPAMWQMLLDSNWKNESQIKIISTGEALSSHLAKKIREISCHFWNLYGPTEATIWAAAYKIEQDNFDSNVVPIGKPIANTQAYVLDKYLQPVPIGVTGELHISGASLAYGYLNQPLITKDKFISNSFDKNRRSHLYKTGDLVRWRPDGNLEYIGRSDDQIKIRGFRIELGEIESSLMKHHFVKQAVACVRSIDGRSQLEAYFTQKKKLKYKNASKLSQSLKDYLLKTLPGYMVPVNLYEVDDFPLNFNGKIDKKILLEQHSNASKLSQPIKEPRSDIEILLLQAWKRVLRIDDINIEDNFFALGGDSITAIQVVAKVNDQGYRLAVKDIFQFPTVVALARHIKEQRVNIEAKIELGQKSTLAPFQSLPNLKFEKLVEGSNHRYLHDIQNIESIYPLSPLQKGLLFHATYTPVSGSYVLQLVWKNPKNSDLDLTCLQQALRLLIERHSVLRTCFVWEDVNDPIQIVQKAVDFPWSIYEWATTDKKIIESERLDNFLKADQQAGFDLSKAPLLRITLIKLLQHQYCIVITLHHILLDGWSLPILMNELGVFYQAVKSNQIPTLPPIIPYSTYIEWQQRQNLASAEQFWKAYLKDFLAPTDLAITQGHNELTQKDMPIDIVVDECMLTLNFSKQIKQFCRQEKLTLNTFFQGAWSLILNRYSQSDDVLFGVTLTTRTAEVKHSDQIVGLLINTLPMRVNLQNNYSVHDYLAEIQKNFSQLACYHYTPLPEIQKWSGISGDTQLFNSILVFENYPIVEDKNQLIKFNDIQLIGPTHYPLTCLVVSNERITIRLSYDKNRISAEYIKCLQGHLKTLLMELSSYPERLIHQINILTPKEYQQIILDWNKTTEINNPIDIPLYQVFERQVEKTPDNVALVFEDDQLTYRELNNLANQLAYYLCDRGIKVNDFVAVFVERGLEMIIAMLGIQKAGGVYIPIDPNYPKERIRYILKDSNASLLITQKRIWQQHQLDLFKNKKLFFIDERENISKQPAENPNIQISANHLIYVMYTSGSTGKPKGVLIEHRSVVNFLNAICLYIKPTSKDNLLAVTPMSFDISALEFYLPLIVGARCIVASYETIIDGKKLKEAISKHQISILQATPITWKMLIEAGWMGKMPSKILCGGEALSQELAEQLIKRTNNLWNLYGPTETTIWSTLKYVSGIEGNKFIVSIGKPITNTQVYVLNPHNQPVPVGITGELNIGGEGIARGYLKQLELTREKFIANPFSKNPKARLYKTGDLVRWLPDGNLEYIGRIDEQVKINGYRIELGEIENCLITHKTIKQAVVVANTHQENGVKLTAYVVPNDQILGREMEYSLFYFAASAHDRDKTENFYDLYLASAKYADKAGFKAIWTPERHFHEVGGQYPNPSVLSAALATITKNIGLRAGSVVLPLHHPLRVAEEWSIVDNLSHGRVGVAFASGWNPKDFAFSPEHYPKRKEIMLHYIEQVRELWRGNFITVTDGMGQECEVKIFPKPKQKELSIWITAAHDPNTFIEAGKLGANLLTHLLGQTIEDLAGKIALYHEALEKHGHDKKHKTVTLMLHTFIWSSQSEAIEICRKPFCDYLRSHVSLATIAQSAGRQVKQYSNKEIDEIIEIAFERYIYTASLIGDIKSCLEIVKTLKRHGVDEIACLIDFGINSNLVLKSLNYLEQLKQTSQKIPDLSSDELVNHLKKYLPAYMIPTTFATVDNLPRHLTERSIKNP